VAGQSINRQQNYVEKQNQGADSHSDASVKEERAERVTPEKDEEDARRIQKVAMEVLQNKWKRSLAPVVMPLGLADRTRGGSRKKAR